MIRLIHPIKPDLIGAIESEMNACWAEAHGPDHRERREAENELLARHPLVRGMADETLIAIAAMAAEGRVGEDDELATAAVILLEQRLAAVA